MRDFTTTFHVRKAADGWTLRQLGRPEPEAVFPQPEDAWAAALDAAKREAPAKAILYGADGGVQSQRRFGPMLYPPRSGDEQFPYFYGSFEHESGFALPPVDEH